MATASNENDIGHLSLLDDIRLHEDDLTVKAKNRFVYHTDILHTFEAYRHILLPNDQVTRVGRHILLSDLDRLHTTCKRVLNYMAENSELLSRPLPAVGPLVICGLPRTGTTLLYNLMACDSNCRALSVTDIGAEGISLVQQLDSTEYEKRASSAVIDAQQMNKRFGKGNEIAASHALFPVEEDQFILYHAGFNVFYPTIMTDDQSQPEKWIINIMNKDFAYDYHETFLRMLNSFDEPRSHWLLKTPIHSIYLDTFLHHYPHAAMIMIHRRLDEVVPSFCSLMRCTMNLYLDELAWASTDVYTKRCIQMIDKMAECIVEFHTRPRQLIDQSRGNVYHLLYDDLMEKPIDAVHQIYDHFGLSWSEEFEAKMKEWVRENPQGKQGRHTYSLAEVGLTREDIETRYNDYIKLFLPQSSSNIVDKDQHSLNNTEVATA